MPAIRHLREVPPPAPPLLRLSLNAPEGAELGSGDDALDAAIAPDERHIAFVATRGGIVQLWHRGLDDEGASPVEGSEGAQLPAWTYAGDGVSFFAGGKLRLVAPLGGTPRDLIDAPDPAGAAWLPDGSVLLASQSRGAIRRLRDGALSDATSLRAGDRAHVYPFATGPAGAFVYTSILENGRRAVRLVRGGDERELTATSGHGQIVGRTLLWTRDGVLLAQPIDPDTGRLEGESAPVSTRVSVTPEGRGLFVASRRLLLTTVSRPHARSLTWFDFDGQTTSTLADPGEFWQVRLSPDDRFVAVTLVAPLLRTLDVAVIPTSGTGDMEPLTRALAADSDPVWAPDGNRLLFRSLQSGRPNLFTRTAHDPDAAEAPLLEDRIDATPSDWDRETVLAHTPDPTSGDDIWSIDLGSGTRTRAVDGGFNETDGRWSPDRRWLAYVSDESGRPDIYVRGWPAAGERIRVSFAGGTRPRWGRDGRVLYFLRESRVMRATRLDGSPPRFAAAVPVVAVRGIRDFDLAHRRDALLALVPVGDAMPAPVAVSIDWQSALPPAD